MSPHHGYNHKASNLFLFLCPLLFSKVDQWMIANLHTMKVPKKQVGFKFSRMIKFTCR